MTVWAVGPFRSSDPRGLVEKVRALNHERTDYELLSLIADAPDFRIPAEVWQELANLAEGIGLSLSIRPSLSTVLPTEQCEKFIMLESPDLAISIESSDLHAAVAQLCHSLQRADLPTGRTVHLRRYSDDGQFNLLFPQELVQALARLRIEIVG